MALSYEVKEGDGATKLFTFSFAYIEASHVAVYVDGVVVPFTWINSNTVEVTTAPTAGATVIIRRETPKQRLVDFQNASMLNEATLDRDSNQSMFVAQEAFDALDNLIFLDTTDNMFDASGRGIKNLADIQGPYRVEMEAMRDAAETSGGNAATSATNAALSESNAADSEVMAEKWAEYPANMQVESGQYSAKHWAAKAQEALVGGDYSTVLGNFRNKIINGSFDVWQRGGGPLAVSATAKFLADRFSVTNRQYPTASQQMISIPKDTLDVNLRNGLEVSISGIGAENAYVASFHRIEDVRTLAGKTVTVSFYAKADGNKPIGVGLNQIFGTGGSASISLTPVTVSLTSGWERYSTTFTVPSVETATIGSDSYTRLDITFASKGTFNAATGAPDQSGVFQFTGVQLEEGSVATTFEHRPISIEEILCYRYFWVLRIPSYHALEVGRGGNSGTAILGPPRPFPVVMRVAPTVINLLSSLFAAVYTVTGDIISSTLTPQFVTTPWIYAFKASVGTTNSMPYSLYHVSSGEYHFDAELA